jgi:hypothetical protein
MPEPETKKPEIQTDPKQNEKQEMGKKIMIAFALEFGLMIVIPLLVFGLGGKWLAQKYDNPAFLYGGVVLAVIISTVWAIKKINGIYNDFTK